MKNLHFDFRDLFRSMRLGFSIQRIWTNGIGLLVSYLVYLIFTYASLLIGGYRFSSVWDKFGLLPCAYSFSPPWYSMGIYWIGFILSIFLILITNTAVSRVTYMTLRNELFYSWRQAFKFAAKKWVSILGALLTFIFIILLFIVGGLVMGLLGRIPFIGELGTSLLALFYIFGALVLLFVSAAFVVGLFLIPAIIATADEDALGSVFQSFSLTYNHPWRLIGYGLITGVLELFSIFVFSWVLKIAYNTFVKIFSVGMGEKFLVIKTHALHLVDQALPPVYGWMQKLPSEIGDCLYLAQRATSTGSIPGVQAVSGFILAIFILFLVGIVFAYGEAVGNAGVTLLYIILYKKRESENLLEREDEELKEEEEEENKAEGGADKEDEEDSKEEKTEDDGK